ncbi:MULTISPECIES: pyridoxal-phosphate-dependent aminotransferase family protein [Salinibaculum]|uniref:pyridoxal-phosphate-dependent aminotransferase family protein n=1 Tax=Salinibaculum TaxID=2732368 RepID=UPI0030CF5A4E
MRDAPETDELLPPDRTLMGPGPSNVHPRVLRSMATPLVGYLDDYYVEVMNDLQELMRYVFQTDNEYTFAVSGTGTAGMETAFSNLLEPGETVLVPSNGYFGERMGAVAERAGADVVSVDAPWGEPLDPADVERAVETEDPSVVGVVHGETSTGVKQPHIDTIADIVHDNDGYLVVDTVASLVGNEFHTDEWGVDVVYTGSQKCLSAPPGVAPITFSDRAAEKVKRREEPVRSWYLDLTGVWEYWGDERNYHHTGPASTNYALREAMRMVAGEGIENVWDRHRRVAGAIKAGVEAMGAPLHVAEDYWLPTLNPVEVPDGVDDGAVIERMMDDHGIEIVGGLGALEGDIFRVGCMGNSARPENAMQFVSAFGSVLAAEGADVDPEAGVAATSRVLGE